MDQDDRPVYSDTAYFTRGRAGYRPDPTPKVNRTDVIVCLLALTLIGCAFYVAIRYAPPAALQTIFVSIPDVPWLPVPPL